MRKIILTWLALCAALFCMAQMPLAGFPPGVFSNKAARDPQPSGPTCAQNPCFISANNAGSSASPSFIGQNLGPAAAHRYILVGALWSETVTGVTMTIAGNAATGRCSTEEATDLQNVEWFVVGDTTDTTGTIAITYTGGTPSRTIIFVYDVISTVGFSDCGVGQSGSSVATLTTGSLSTPSSGVTVIAGSTHVATTNTFSSGIPTITFDNNPYHDSSSSYFSGYNNTTTGANTWTANWSPTSAPAVIDAISFNP
jgi:hypothetical protein